MVISAAARSLHSQRRATKQKDGTILSAISMIIIILCGLLSAVRVMLEKAHCGLCRSSAVELADRRQVDELEQLHGRLQKRLGSSTNEKLPSPLIRCRAAPCLLCSTPPVLRGCSTAAA